MNCEILPLVLIRVSGLPLPAGQDSFFPVEKYIAEKKELENELQNAENQLLDFLNGQLLLLTDSSLRTYYYNLRKAFFNNRENHITKLTASYLPEALSPLFRTWQNAKYALSDFFLQIEQAYHGQIQVEWTALQQFALSETLQRSLLFISHDLLRALPAFSAKNISDWDKKDRQIAFSLYEYQQRGRYKTSPLSRLTTLHLQPLHSTSDSPAGDDEDFPKPEQKVVVTPNAAILPALYEVLFQDPSFYGSLSIALNPSIHDKDHQYVWLYFDGDQEALQKAPVSKSLQCVYAILEPKPLLYTDFLAQLGEYIDQEETAIQQFIWELVDFGFLSWLLPEKGLSSSWCGALYQYLGFLPTSPIITETAYCLYWLRNTARSLPYQSIPDAMRTQMEALEFLQQHLEKYGVAFKGLRPEQVFYEDVQAEAQLVVPNEAIHNWVNQFVNWTESQLFMPSSGIREQINRAGFAQLKPGESMDFLQFDPTFVPDNADAIPEYKKPKPLPSALGVGLALSTSGAVVNSLFPGGGKLMSRWLHLFPAHFKEELQKWPDTDAIAFPWQGWSNANFQSYVSQISLAIPDGKTNLGKRNIILSDIEVYHHPQQGLQLREKGSGFVIRFVDLGLEAPETRPPMMQALWCLGVPDVSWNSILRQIRAWERLDDYCFMAQRIDYLDITLSRQAWAIKIEAINHLLDKKHSPLMLKLVLNLFLMEKGIPRRFFAQFPDESPQFFDRDSIISIALLAKKIQKYAEGLLRIEEMLPVTEEWAVHQNGTKRAAEAIVEWKSIISPSYRTDE